MDALGSAVLTKEIEADSAVAAVVSLEEVRRALDDRDASPELVLEVVRGNEHGEREQDTIRIDWSRQDLENLLARATEDRVVLTFDRAQLEQALGDVEAHGLRERALVFAVAATGVLATGPGIAHAMVTDVSSTGGYAATSSTATTFLTDASSGAGYVEQASAADQMVSDASSAAGYVEQASAADQMVSDASSSAGYAAQASAADQMVSDASSGAGYVAQASAADQMVSDASSAAGYVAPSPVEDAVLTDVSSGGGYAATAATADTGSVLTDVSSGGGYAAPPPSSPGDGGFTLNALDPATDGAIAGALVLTIAAAAFTARRRRPEQIA
jgi:hypothetical protein